MRWRRTERHDYYTIASHNHFSNNKGPAIKAHDIVAQQLSVFTEPALLSRHLRS
jgi:hypothetical protein